MSSSSGTLRALLVVVSKACFLSFCVTIHKIVLFIKAGVVTVPIMTAVCLGNDHPNAGSFSSRSGLAKYQGYPFILFETRADQHMARIAPLRGSVRGGLVLGPFFVGLVLCPKSFPHTVGEHFGVPILGPGFGLRNGAENWYRQPVESTLSQAWLMSAFWVPDA